MSICLTWVVLMGLLLDAPAPSQEATPPGPTASARAVVTAVDPEVDRLLMKLEESSADLRSFTAAVRYEVIDDLLGRSETRTGRLIYRTREGERRFAILFDQLTVRNQGQAGGRREERRQHYVFDGQWLAEIDHGAKQFIKHQVVAPGRTLDPLKLGEGPFPLPVGQPRAEVLARFDVTATAAPTEGPLASLVETHRLQGLRLVPRSGTGEAREYARVDLFYDLDTLLPVGIHVTLSNGDVKLVRLGDALRNPPLSAAEEAALSIDDPDPSQWAISILPWKDRP